MSDVAITVENAGTPASVIEGEPAAVEAVAEATETVADANVEIARIEAERSVTETAIRADTEIQTAQIFAENREPDEWRTQLAETQSQLATLAQSISELSATVLLLTNPSPPSVEDEAAPVVAEEIEPAEQPAAPEPPAKPKPRFHIL